MKVTHENVEKVFEYILSQICDDNGRGEYDNESDLLIAVERTIEQMEEEQHKNEIEYGNNKETHKVTGIMVHINSGRTYNILCKRCYDNMIDVIRKDHGLTTDIPIFLSSEYTKPPECDECEEPINCKIIGEE